ncbi:MAG: class I SAM-dependent methyltransferase [Proteobacteria bacterium]|nr:class I SAM-dependent methyltransferase [Pseudomonadota bacterium]
MTRDAKDFTPALGKAWLTPLYDLAIALLTRESTWRRALARQINPVPGDNILDVGCGTGSLALMLKDQQPGAIITGLDPDPEVLARAARKADGLGLDINLVAGFLEEKTFPKGTRFTKVTSSLVLHQVPVAEKERILRLARGLLAPGGLLHVADYGLQRTALMRTGFRIVQSLDGYENTTPNARGILPGLMNKAGFSNIEEMLVVATPTGSISLYRAARD